MGDLELRMYGMTPYQLNGRQIGIQFGHAVVEYGLKYFNTDLYQDWANNHKTFIILNGGISNHTINRYSKSEYIGTMENHLNTLIENEIDVSAFYEPDLNDMLSSICFIVDERVFNKEKYPDFDDWIVLEVEDIKNIETNSNYYSIIDAMRKSDKYEKWVSFIGGERNLFLREFLKNFKLA